MYYWEIYRGFFFFFWARQIPLAVYFRITGNGELENVIFEEKKKKKLYDIFSPRERFARYKKL